MNYSNSFEVADVRIPLTKTELAYFDLPNKKLIVLLCLVFKLGDETNKKMVRIIGGKDAVYNTKLLLKWRRRKSRDWKEKLVMNIQF